MFTAILIFNFYRAMHVVQSAVRIAIVCFLSVCLSVRLFVTLVIYGHIGWITSKAISR